MDTTDKTNCFLLKLTTTELSILGLGVEDKIADLEARIAFSGTNEHRERWLASARSIKAKIESSMRGLS